jgi:hypothetical protein
LGTVRPHFFISPIPGPSSTFAMASLHQNGEK